MAKASRQRPWIVQMCVNNSWYDTDAYRDEEMARAMMNLASKRAPEVQWRVVKATEYNSKRRIVPKT